MYHFRVLRFLLFSVFIIPCILSAQVLNGGFESWTNGSPNDWVTNNVPGAVSPITQSASSRSGSSALRGEVLTFANAAYPPILLAGADGGGFPVNQRYGSLTGYYQFSPVGGDVLYIYVLLYDNFTPIAAGEVNLGSTASSYTPFNLPIEYFNAATPNLCFIEIVVLDTLSDDPHVGSVFLMDDLSLSGTTAITSDLPESVPQTFSLDQNYPNPFNPSTSIKYGVPEAGQVKLDIYNELGEYVTTLVNGRQSAGEHVIQWQPKDVASGVYLYRLETNQGVQTRKMIFMK